MEASASPRNPRLRTLSSSIRFRILLVAWRFSASGSSSFGMPQPLSVTDMRLRPPPSIRTSIRVAPASSAFSTSSFTTDAGRSTTSPAAIWLISWSGSSAIERLAAGFSSFSISSIHTPRIMYLADFPTLGPMMEPASVVMIGNFRYYYQPAAKKQIPLWT